MVAFIKDGMDIPDHLVHAQENGRVVFFCGAGISMAAGLPDFEKLVNSIYSTLHIRKEDAEKKLMDAKQYDRVLEHLEQWLIGHKEMLRKPLMQLLQPTLGATAATETHKALLQLATSQNRITRLVTTNFDRLFEKVIDQQKLSVTRFLAPNMPAATSGQWSGLVYLHGQLPESYDQSKLNRLVLTSSDFGVAYLTEQWATNFVKALLQNYIVCFVGYSLDDHLLQYLMSASASGNSRHNAYAFAALAEDEQKEYAQWRAKGVTPVFYNPEKGHVRLHRTLKAWAETYSAGIEGKKKIIDEHARAAPPSSHRSNYAVGRVLWALTDVAAAKYFSEMKPVPPLEWLPPLLENSFGQDDLSRFGIATGATGKSAEEFSLLRRQTPISQTPLMSIFATDGDADRSGWDNVMWHLADWISRHLDDLNLIRWIIYTGHQLHNNFARAILWKIQDIELSESRNDQEKLARIADGAPHAIPCKNMRVLWHLILSGQTKLSWESLDFHTWLDNIQEKGWMTVSNLEVRKMLAPRIYLSLLQPPHGPFSFVSEEEANVDPASMHITEIVHCRVELASDHVHSALLSQAQNQAWEDALPSLLSDFTILLRDALDLMHIIGAADDSFDMSVHDQPSISSNPQNSQFHDWTALIDLSRKAWIATSQLSSEKARNVAEQWIREQYPLFKRLAFFAATHDTVIPHEQALNWLLSENCKWLWSSFTRREAFRLIVALAPKLPNALLRQLETAIVNGPPRAMFREDLGSSEFSEIAEDMIWFRLAKVRASGAVLGPAAANKLQESEKNDPNRQLREDNQDELTFRIEPVSEERQPLPTQRDELLELVKNHQELNPRFGDRWRGYCRDEFANAVSVLRELANNNEWPKAAWRDAFDAWGMSENLLETSFAQVCGILTNAPDKIMQSLGIYVALWLRRVAEKVDHADEGILRLSDRIIGVRHSEDEEFGHDSLLHVHDHPVGSVVQALMELFYRHAEKGAKKNMAEILQTFSRICNTQTDQFRHGRLVLAEYTADLHYHENKWTKKHLLPLFDWERSEQEAQAVWTGCLSRPSRFYGRLLSDLKGAFLQTAENCNKLDPDLDHTDNYADLLTVASLDLPGIFSEEESILSKGELRDATEKLPPKLLDRVTSILHLRLSRAGENQGECWKNQVRPYLEYIWPKSEGNRKTQNVSSNLAELCTAAGEFFPEAWELVRYWLQSLKHTRGVLGDLRKKDICRKFPKESREFLSKIIGDHSFYNRRELQACLDIIKGVDPNAPNNPDFQDLERRCN